MVVSWYFQPIAMIIEVARLAKASTFGVSFAFRSAAVNVAAVPGAVAAVAVAAAARRRRLRLRLRRSAGATTGAAAAAAAAAALAAAAAAAFFSFLA